MTDLGDIDTKALRAELRRRTMEQEASAPVKALAERPTNAHLIADLARVGYLRQDWLTCDPTYGEGVFWQIFRPDRLQASDLDPLKSPVGESLDATDLPYATGIFQAFVIDGPYMLNGRPDPIVGARYGVHVPASREERHDLLGRMLAEGARCTGRGGYVLFKCQNQVNGGAIRWQERIFADVGERHGLRLRDRAMFESYRPQPDRGQQHLRQNLSAMLVFEKVTN